MFPYHLSQLYQPMYGTQSNKHPCIGVNQMKIFPYPYNLKVQRIRETLFIGFIYKLLEWCKDRYQNLHHVYYICYAIIFLSYI